MAELHQVLERLQSDNPSKRYEACEELRVASSIPEEALVALQRAADDPDRDVADAAQRALGAHRPAPQPPEELALPVTTEPLVPLPMPELWSGDPAYLAVLERRLAYAEEELRALRAAVDRATSQSAQAMTRLPDTNIISPKFLSRAFACWGHVIVAQLIVAIPIYCIAFLIGLAGNF